MHFLLSAILDYWADEMDVPPTELPQPRKAKESGRAARVSEARRKRAENLSAVGNTLRLTVDDLSETSSAPLLHAGVLWEAVRDWADNCCSPYAVDQRTALQAYWWVMSLPVTHPKGMSRSAWMDVADGRIRRHRVPADTANPLPHVGLSLTSLWVDRLRDPLLPPALHASAEYDDSAITFLSCCSALGLSPGRVRRFIHSVPPD